MKQQKAMVYRAAPTSDISVLILATKPTLFLHRTLTSVCASIQHAQSQGITCDITLLLIDADANAWSLATRFQHRHPELSLHTVSKTSETASDAQQFLIQHTTGTYIALVTGENLFGEDWLTLAYQKASKAQTASVLYHAEFSHHFQTEKRIERHFSSHASGVPLFQPQDFAARLPWTSLVLFSQTAFQNFLISACQSRSSTVETSNAILSLHHLLLHALSTGAEVQIVPGTCNFMRDQPTTQNSCSLLPASKLLDPTGIAASGAIPVQKAGKRRRLTHKLAALVQKHAPELPALLERIKSGCRSLWRRRHKRPLENASPEQAKLWRDLIHMHSIEPQVFPTAQSLTPISGNLPSHRLFADKYLVACSPIKRHPTHVLLIPWLKKGGADLEVLHYVRGIQESSPNHHVLVITTNDGDSPWSSRLSSDVMQLSLGEIVNDLPHEEQQKLLATLLVQLQPQAIHLVNSRLGFATLKKYGASLSQHSKIIVSCFCEDITSDGRVSGFAFEEQPEVFPFLSGICADNQAILDKLQATYGYPAEKLFLHYMPIDLATPIVIPPREKLQVLWAGRLDRQKRPDILRQIAEKLRGHPIHFTIYGSAILKRKSAYQKWSNLTNVSYRGPYDGFETLPLHQFDLLLHTAQWEGLPNVLLEAYANGLPIVASDVGGVSELVRTEENGVCISPYDDVDAYCNALIKLQQNRELLSQYATAGRSLIAERHSWKTFLQTLADIPGYLLTNSTAITPNKVA